MESSKVPKKEEMDSLVPTDWPESWNELKRLSSEGELLLILGHRSPNPNYSKVEQNNLQHHIIANVWTLPISQILNDVDLDEYDFIAPFRITFIKDSELHLLDLNESIQKYSPEMEDAARMLREALQSGDLTDDEREQLESVQKLMGDCKEFVSMVEEGDYLRAKARIVNGEFPTSVSVGRFIIDGSLIGSERLLFPGNKSIHSLKCYETRSAHQSYDYETYGYPATLVSDDKIIKWSSKTYFVMLGSDDEKIEFKPGFDKPPCRCKHCTFHYRADCSTIKDEGFVYNEEVEKLISNLFLILH